MVIAAAAPRTGWVVEVVSSGRTAELVFDSAAANARLVDPAKRAATPAPSQTAGPAAGGPRKPVSTPNLRAPIQIPPGVKIPEADDEDAVSTAPSDLP
jgi:hypothetical protein